MITTTTDYYDYAWQGGSSYIWVDDVPSAATAATVWVSQPTDGNWVTWSGISPAAVYKFDTGTPAPMSPADELSHAIERAAQKIKEAV